MVVGTPIAGRTRAETEDLIGFFVNMLPLRVEVDGERRSGPRARGREVCLGAYAHQDLPFERLVQELLPVRDRAGHAAFQVMLILQNAPRDARPPAGADTARRGRRERRRQVRPHVAFVETPRGLAAGLEYAADLVRAGHDRPHVWPPPRGPRGGHAAPICCVIDLPLLPSAERAQMVVAWNDTAAPFPAGATLHGLFEQQAARTPDAAAVIFEGRAVTYRELDEQSDRIAHRLLDLELEPGARAGICLPRSPEMIAALLGVLKTGGAYVPLDPTYPRERLGMMIEDGKVGVLLADACTAAALGPHDVRVVRIDDPDGPLCGPATKLQHRAASAGVAYILYTSGSAGRPKSVCGTHAGMVNRLFWMWQRFPFERDEVAARRRR